MSDNKLATVQTGAIAGPRLGLPTGNELQALQQYGDIVVKSGMAPKHVTTWQAAVVTMRYGHQLGIDEFTALNNIYLQQGKPAAFASLQHALILRDHGDDAMLPVELSPERVTLRCKRRSSATPVNISYTIEEARAAGLVTKGGNWEKYPQDMLFARAVSRAGRMLFRDSTMGMYTPEEVGIAAVEIAGEVIDVTPAPRPAAAVTAEVIDADTGEIFEPEPVDGGVVLDFLNAIQGASDLVELDRLAREIRGTTLPEHVRTELRGAYNQRKIALSRQPQPQPELIETEPDPARFTA